MLKAYKLRHKPSAFCLSAHSTPALSLRSCRACCRAVVTEQEQQLRQQDLQLQQQQQLHKQQPADQYNQAALKFLKQQLETSNVQLKQATSQLQEQKEQVMQLKREVKAQTGQADQSEARAASVQRTHDRVAQQLELAQTELRKLGSDVSAKVRQLPFAGPTAMFRHTSHTPCC